MKMKKKKDAATVCEHYCSWYKPGRNEEFECQGSVVVHRLLDRGSRFGPGRPRSPMMKPAPAEALRETVCRTCSFSASDCDYAGQCGDALPCGGFILLSHLLDEGATSLDEIRKACR